MSASGGSFGIIIKAFSDYISEKVFKAETVEVSQEILNKQLQNNSNLDIESLTKLSLTKLEKELKPIDYRIVDNCLEYIYHENKSEKINKRILEIIEILNKQHSELSVQRNNIENSIKHDK
ncbi:hypothetical protein [Polaribacter sp. Hel1_85]|uniref:hypothetical protein n=1 Tax=Polaribacter sp. Hel1_85 TaxID=1250005 RepID=UPI00052E127D|nr:hypothetical protein [Polaribacter sp. Hel1_85]KGL58408.1 hypothetical protein PHEL85_3467 [Polaribacter sp. Hel1_85]